jgi:hypothetical protein
MRGGILLVIILAAGGILAAIAFRQREVSMVEISRLTTPSLPTVTPYYEWPSYLAKDYGKAGQPRLSVAEVTKIRNTLAVLKPCQRAFLRYASPKNSDFLPFVMLFQPSTVSEQKGGDLRPTPHILGEGNADYEPWSGEAFVTPYWESDKISADVNDRGCDE